MSDKKNEKFHHGDVWVWGWTALMLLIKRVIARLCTQSLSNSVRGTLTEKGENKQVMCQDYYLLVWIQIPFSCWDGFSRGQFLPDLATHMGQRSPV